MDQTKYVNAYIDSTVGMLHENISQLLQLKAQIKITNDVVSEKDNIISELTNKLNTNQTFEQEYHRIVQRNQELENEIAALNNKVSHIDTFSRQISEMKYMIVEKDNIIEHLKNELNINKNKKKKSMKIVDIEVEEKTNTSTSNTDDF